MFHTRNKSFAPAAPTLSSLNNNNNPATDRSSVMPTNNQEQQRLRRTNNTNVARICNQHLAPAAATDTFRQRPSTRPIANRRSVTASKDAYTWNGLFSQDVIIF